MTRYLLAAAVLAGVAASAHAAITNIQPRLDSFGLGVDMTAQGSVDWKLFNYAPEIRGQTAGGASYVHGPAEKAGGTAIGDGIPGFASGALQGLNNTSFPMFSWTDGEAPNTTEVGIQSAIYNWPNQVGVTWSFEVNATDGRLNVYVGNWNSTATLYAKFQSDASLTTIGSWNDTGQGRHSLFTFDFDRSGGETGPLSIVWEQTANGGGNIVLDAATLGVVPEPAALSLLGLGALVLLRRRP